MPVNHFSLGRGPLSGFSAALDSGDEEAQHQPRHSSQQGGDSQATGMTSQAHQGILGSTRFDPFSASLFGASEGDGKQPVGRARAGTLPSSWSRFAGPPGDDGDASTSAAATQVADKGFGQPSPWSNATGSTTIAASRQRENASRIFGARLAMPSSKMSYTGSVPGTPSAYDTPHDFPGAGIPAVGNHMPNTGRQEAIHRSSLAALRQASHIPFQDSERSASSFASRSRTPSNLGYGSPFDVNTLYTAPQAFGSADEFTRSRSASNASQKGLATYGANNLAPSIFTPTWTDRSITTTDPDSSASRRSSTLGSSSRPGSKTSFNLDLGHQIGQSSGTVTTDHAYLDNAQDVHTLDYLGLEHDDVPSASSGRSGSTMTSQQNRLRASTLASLPPSNAGGPPGGLLSGGAGRLDGIDEYRGARIVGDLDATAQASAGRPILDASTLRDAQVPSQNAFVGRNRAGTLAALGGPGGRQRLEQELLRMVTAGNQSGMTNAEVGSLLRAHLDSLGLGGQGGILEGFPHLELHTPPPLSTRQSPHTTQPTTPTLRTARSRSSLDDLGQHFSAVSLGRSQLGQSVTSLGQQMNRNSSQLSANPSSTHQAPSRSLWVGNLSSSTTGQELMHVFATYGAIESLRLLPEKECGFVNFVDVADAVHAREDVLTRLGGRLESLGTGPGGRVRIGFGRIDANASAPSANAGQAQPSGHLHDAQYGSSSQSTYSTSVMDAHTDDGSGNDQSTPPTRALWIGSIPNTATPSTLLSVFQPFGPIESARVLSHKNCGFINFERVDDAVRARKMLNGRDVLGSEVGAMRIGFAKVPNRNVEVFPGPGTDGNKAVNALAQVSGAQTVTQTAQDQIANDELEHYRSNLVVSLINEEQRKGAALAQEAAQAQPADSTTSTTGAPPSTRPSGTSASSSIVPASDKGGVPLPAHMAPQARVSDLQLLMRELSQGESSIEQDVASVGVVRQSKTYYMTLPLVTEVSSGRRFETSRLREDRRTIESGRMSLMECDRLAVEYIDSIVDLASDYIGNTLVQKFFEVCSDDVKLEMLNRLAPHLAVVGCHKNGTWAAQKILQCASNAEQISLIAQHLRPYIPGLLLNEFGNYVVQCCLPWKQYNEFVFDAMVDRCWEIAQGRYGARSMRACLENAHTTHLQRKRVAITIILNSVPLATSSNGALLLSWLLEYSGLTQSYRLLAPRLAPHLTHLCTHKVASPTVLRLITQTAEPSASRAILQALFEPRPEQMSGAGNLDATTDPPHSHVLEDIVVDQVHGSQFIAKALVSPTLKVDQRIRYSDQVKALLLKHNLVGIPAYRRLCEDLGLASPTFSTQQQMSVPPISSQRPAARPPYSANTVSGQHVSPELHSPPYGGMASSTGVFPEQYPVGQLYSGPTSPPQAAYGRPAMPYQSAQMPPPIHYTQPYATSFDMGTTYAAQPIPGFAHAAVRPGLPTQGNAVYSMPATSYNAHHR